MSIKSLLPLLLAVLAGCSSWQAPPALDYADFRQRAIVQKENGVEVRALVLSRQDGQRLFGADVFAHGVEPVWLELTNGTDRQLTLLHAGVDPDYFSPLEVSWSLHGSVIGGGNEAVDRHIQSVAFPRKGIPAGGTASGVVFTNPHLDVKLVNVDLISENRFLSFTLFPPIPDAQGNVRQRTVWRYDQADVRDYSSERQFKAGLEQFLCCHPGFSVEGISQPLTAVLVGRREDLGTALARRGYRWGPQEEDTRERVFGRPPDYVLRKWDQAGAPGNWLRIWTLPLTFQGRPVMVAQTGAPLGGRFGTGLGSPSADPAVDHIRDLLVQELFYSRGLAKLAIMDRVRSQQAFAGVTDGRIAVLFVAARALGIDQALIVDWNTVDWDTEIEPYGQRPDPGN